MLQLCLGGLGCTQQAMLRCGRCQTRMYCSEACQKREWPAHRLYCSAWTGQTPLQDDEGEHCAYLEGGLHPDALIVVYALAGDLLPAQSQVDDEVMLPQWYMLDHAAYPARCLTPSYSLREMEAMGRATLVRAGVQNPPAKVLFYWTHELMLVNGVEPFGTSGGK